MADKEGAVVAMDARTGEILAMVSKPTFNPNDFAVRIPQEEWQKLNTDKETPLLNRAIQAQLAPGSVFKIVMAAAMLESKEIPRIYTVYCPGHANFYGREFHCWRPQGHGEVESPQSHRRFLRRIFLQRRQAARHRQDRLLRLWAGPGQAHRS